MTAGPASPDLAGARIAVMCAPHFGNSGMHSVDLAAVRFFREIGAQFRLFTTQPKGNLQTTFDGETVSLLTDPRDYDAFTHLVFWGDFLNNRQYGHGGYAMSHKKLGMTERHGPGHVFWRRLYTLSDHANPDLRVLGVGGNFQHAFHQPKFATDFAQLAHKFHRIYPRDEFSSRNLARFFAYERLDVIRQGMDVAFLLRPTDPPPAREDHFCWFFGRSSVQNAEAVVAAVAAATGLTPVHLADWLKLPRSNADAAFAAERASIASARFVLTDTYHLLVNTITQRTPIIAIARNEPRQEGTLGDFKKHTLLHMLGLSPCLMAIDPGLPGPDPQVVAARAAQIVTDGFDTTARYALAQRLADRFRADLVEDLTAPRTPA